MTPERLVPLVGRALGRPGNVHELDDWAAVLAHVTDADAEQGLTAYRAANHNPPTPADVRRAAASIANDRAMRAETARLQHERTTGTTLDGQPLVPMPDFVRAPLIDLAKRQAARRQVLEQTPVRDQAAALEQARAELTQHHAHKPADEPQP